MIVGNVIGWSENACTAVWLFVQEERIVSSVLALIPRVFNINSKEKNQRDLSDAAA
jgi:hypothetical protein